MRLALLLLSLLPVVLAGCPSADDRAERAREATQEALARGDRAAAVAALEELRGAGPKTPAALVELTALMVRAGEAPQAIWLLEEALPLHPERDDLRLQLGRIAMLVQDPSRARAAVAPIGSDSEEHLEALLVLGRAELELGDLDAALGHYEEAMRRYPGRPEAAFARVQALLQEGKREEVRPLVDEALGSPELPDEAKRRFEILAADLDAQGGETDAAVERLRVLVEVDPDDAQAWNALIQVMRRARRGAEALALVESAVEEDPEAPLLRGLLADLYAAHGRAEEAQVELEKLIELNDTASTRFALARFHLQQSKPELAAEVLSEALSKHPEAEMLRMHLAETCIEAGDIDGGKSALEEFRTALPRNPHVDYLRARIALAEGDTAGAAARLQKLVSRLDAPYTQFWLGRALEAQGDLVGAARRYGLAMHRNPRDPAAALALVAVSRRRGDWRGVAGAAQRVIQVAPGTVEAYEILAEALLQLGEPKAAEEMSRKLVEAAPERSAPTVLLARALRAQGRHAESDAALAEAIETHGSTLELEAERALGLGLQGRVDEGIARLEEIAADHPDSAVTQHALAMLLLGRGDREAGSDAVDRALALAPEDVSPLATRARFLASRGLWTEAQVDAERYLAALPDDAPMHFLLGAVLQGAGDAEGAIAAYRRAAELDGEHAAARNNLALLLAERGEMDAALASAQEAYRLADSDPHVLDTLGWLYYRSGLVDRSIPFLERAHDANPEGVERQLHLALAYQGAGRSDDARALLAALAERDDLSPEHRKETDEALRSLQP